MLNGAQAHARRIDADVGGTLYIESPQDTVEQESKQSGGGIRAQVALGTAWNVSGNYNQSKASGHSRSVGSQSGLFAGEGGYHITADSVRLKGGTIASAADKDHNELTARSFSFEDIRNESSYSASSMGIGAGYGGSLKGSDGFNQSAFGRASQTAGQNMNKGLNYSPTLPQHESGDSQGYTRSLLSEGNITIDGRQTSARALGIHTDSTTAHHGADSVPDLQNLLDKQQTIAQSAREIAPDTPALSGALLGVGNFVDGGLSLVDASAESLAMGIHCAIGSSYCEVAVKNNQERGEILLNTAKSVADGRLKSSLQRWGHNLINGTPEQQREANEQLASFSTALLMGAGSNPVPKVPKAPKVRPPASPVGEKIIPVGESYIPSSPQAVKGTTVTLAQEQRLANGELIPKGSVVTWSDNAVKVVRPDGSKRVFSSRDWEQKALSKPQLPKDYRDDINIGRNNPRFNQQWHEKIESHNPNRIEEIRQRNAVSSAERQADALKRIQAPDRTRLPGNTLSGKLGGPREMNRSPNPNQTAEAFAIRYLGRKPMADELKNGFGMNGGNCVGCWRATTPNGTIVYRPAGYAGKDTLPTTATVEIHKNPAIRSLNNNENLKLKFPIK